MTEKHSSGDRRDTSTSPRPAGLGERRGLRRDVRKLAALEWVQTTLGIGLLVAVVGRAFVTAEEDAVAAAITIVGLLVMVIFTLALRVHVGRESLRRDVEALERDLDQEGESLDLRTSAYRGRLPLAHRAVMMARPEPPAGRRRRRRMRLRDKARHAHVREHGLRRG